MAGPAISPSQARAQLAAGHRATIYLLIGADDAEKGALVADLAACVEPGLRPFNVERFYGTDASLGQVIDAARTLPFGEEPRVVVLLQAEALIEPKRESEEARRDRAALSAYLDAPVPQTVLVLAAASLDGRTRMTRALRRAAVEVECGGAESLGDPERWIRQALAEADLRAERSAVRLVIERAGEDMGRLRAEVERLRLYCAGHGTVSREDVLAVVGSPTARDDWAVTRAIERGRAAEALRALAHSLEGGAVPVMVLGQLAWFVRTRYPPAGVRDVIETLFETDLAIKSSGGDPRVLLERLVVRMCERDAGRHAARHSASGGR